MQKLRKKRNPLSEESGIYFIINVHTAKIYVGSAVNLERRRIAHFSQLKNNKHHNYHLQNSFELYGEDSFLFRIVETCNKKDLLKLEQKYINILNVLDGEFGYNICPTAGSSLGIKRSDETKKRISEAKSGEKSLWYGKFGSDHNKSKTVLQLTHNGEVIRVFGSTREAERMTGVYQTHISEVCRGKAKTAGGYYWKYKDAA